MVEKSATEQIDDIIKLYGGWKGETLASLRAVITAANPDIVEEIKWKMPSRPEGLPVWTCGGKIVCLAETFKDNIKLVFTKGAVMKDPAGLFNARLNSSTDRAIEFKQGTAVNAEPLTGLVRQAAEIVQTDK